MLEGLFDEEAASFEVEQSSSGHSTCTIPRPIPPRSNTMLCGLSNLGATCYMNALLQTLYFTPELRESLFALSDKELGIGQDGAILRAIPVQLQNLFARMLLADQDSVGVEGLISSFGWTNNEEMQQHDVQELNRILFDALESSLVGTTGERLISQLYHGTSVQHITCEKCNSVSEREEDFLDIPVPLSNRAGLEESLKEMYCDIELLEGSNQYHCGNCNSFVNAKRSCTLRKLPPVLTFALLRFLYDFEKGQRYKDLSNFKFPLSLNMTPYLDNSKKEDRNQELIYDLFSIVIHSGSTHSGHYVAFIKDVDGLGKWTHPVNEPICYQKPDTSEILEVTSPLELLCSILEQLNGQANVAKISKKMQDQTGVTWNKRFKHNYGPISKFIKNHSEVFEFDSGNVLLKTMTAPTTQTNEFRAPNKDDTPLQDNTEIMSPIQGQCWFEFNDSHVSSLLPQSIEKMFSGRQSAYMLFYRLRSLTRPKEAFGNSLYCVPARLQDEVAAVNAVLMADREHYDNVINKVTLTIHPGLYYKYINGAALQNIYNGLTHAVEIDRRKTVAELKILLLEEIGEPVSIDGGMIIHVAKEIPAGLHLYECVTSNDDMVSLMDRNVVSNCHLFVWDGLTVDGEIVPTGKDNEPILLNLNYPSHDGSLIEVAAGFSRQTTLFELRKYFGTLLNCPPTDMILSQVQKSRRSGDASIVSLPPTKDSNTISQLQFENGERLTAEIKVKKGYKSFAHSVADKQNKMLTFLVENRCTFSNVVEEYSVYPVEAGKNEKLHQVKQHIISQLKLNNVEGGGRLRIDDDFQGLGPPLCEELSIVDAGIEAGIRVVLEPGSAPLHNEIFLKCAAKNEETKSNNIQFHDIILDRKSTIKQCCDAMIDAIGLSCGEWHLCKTNWCGEIGDILDDETATIEGLNLRDGDCILIESGRLPPKGYIRLSVYLYISNQIREYESTSMMEWFKGDIKEIGVKREVEDETEVMESDDNTIPLHEQDHTLYYPALNGSLSYIDDIEISKELTINELKQLILTLPQFCVVDILTTDFLRVRDLINNRPGRIFKDKTHLIKRFKLASGNKICCQILPDEEFLTPTSIVFNLHLRQSITKTYSQPVEVTYDTAQSTTPHGLRHYIGQLLALPPERLVIAKHKFESFQWIPIQDSSSSNEKGKKGRRRNRGGGVAKGGAKSSGHVNIKNAPISLKDGDILAVKDLQFDPDDTDDFMTPSDRKGQAILVAVQEEKRQRRKAKSDLDDDNSHSANGNRKKKQRKPEIGIKIFVPDFAQHVTDGVIPVDNNCT